MANTNLYVNNLPDGLDDAGFRQIFEGHGSIVSTKYYSQQRYGFIKFETEQEATAVISFFDNQSVAGKTMSVKFAKEKSGKGSSKGGDSMSLLGSDQSYSAAPAIEARTSGSHVDDQIYILNLPIELGDDGLRDLFSGYGSVKWSKFMVKEGQPTAAAMVQFEDSAQAAWVVENLDGNIPQSLEHPIRVQFKSKGKGKGASLPTAATSPKPMMPARAAPYVGNPPLHAQSAIVTDDNSNLYIKGLPPTCDKVYLYEIFAPFGGITSVKVTSTPRGTLGFVKFVKELSATMAIKHTHGVTQRDGYVLDVSIAKKKY